jgi:tight adherence protein B
MAALPILLLTLGTVGLIVYLGRDILGISGSAEVAMRQSIREMAATHRSIHEARLELEEARSDESETKDSGDNEDDNTLKSFDNKLTLQKRLKYAQLSHVPPYMVSLAIFGVTSAAVIVTSQLFESVIQAMSLMAGPLFVNWLINRRIKQRVDKFDKDYPAFLLSLVGMLKTGLNPIQGLEAAATNLEDSSLVRKEVELMLERLRLGVSEERSIGSFGEDINHPEIELFVQALTLSRRVGGNLSDTLDRLARQVRKRQYFRSSANAAVGLQRGSILFILGILSSLELYLYFAWPDCVTVTWTDPGAKKVAQVGLALILTGMYWVRQVTNIRV